MKKLLVCCIGIFFILVSCSDSGVYYSNPNNYYSGNIEGQNPGDEYQEIDEIGFINAQAEPLSTFRVDTSTAAYANIRRTINNGGTVVKNSVRIEEVVNYFKYDYLSPSQDDEHPLKLNAEIAPCPWNEEAKLLSIGLKAREIAASSLPRSNLVFLLDVSGSMDRTDKIGLMQEAFTMLTENIGEDDIISVVTYASSEATLLDGESGANKSRISNIIQDLQAGGSTAGAEGIQTAYELAKKHFIEDGNNRVILATDGDFNVGISSTSELESFIKSKKEQDNIYLSALGFGYGNLKDNKLEALAQNGNGNHYYIDSILEAKKVLVEELGGTLHTIAKDSKVQIEFNLKYIEKYRLLGYENRMIDNDDFDDDTVDGGEIGSNHSVTALYEIILEDEDVASTMEENYVKVSFNYKDPNGDTSKTMVNYIDAGDELTTPSFNIVFQGALVETCLLLRDSQYKGSASYQAVITRLNSNEGVLSDDYRVEFRELLNKLVD